MQTALKTSLRVANDDHRKHPRVIPTITLSAQKRSPSFGTILILTVLTSTLILGLVFWWLSIQPTLSVMGFQRSVNRVSDTPHIVALPSPATSDPKTTEVMQRDSRTSTSPSIENAINPLFALPSITKDVMPLQQTPIPHDTSLAAIIDLVVLPLPSTSSRDHENIPTDIFLPAEELAPSPEKDPAIAITTASIEEQPVASSTHVAPHVIYLSGINPTAKEAQPHARGPLETNDDQTILAVYNDLLASDKTNRGALEGKAFTLMLNGQYEMAIAIDQQLLKLYPDDDTARLNLITALGRSIAPGAIIELENMAGLEPKNAPVQAALAQQFARHGDLSQSLEHLDRAVKLAPHNILYQLELAILEDRLGNTTDALSLYRQVLKGLPGEAAALPLSLLEIEERVDFLISPQTLTNP